MQRWKILKMKKWKNEEMWNKKMWNKKLKNKEWKIKKNNKKIFKRKKEWDYELLQKKRVNDKTRHWLKFAWVINTWNRRTKANLIHERKQISFMKKSKFHSWKKTNFMKKNKANLTYERKQISFMNENKLLSWKKS
jgi:hypothetical protein